jgi:hypothetical protein
VHRICKCTITDFWIKLGVEWCRLVRRFDHNNFPLHWIRWCLPYEYVKFEIQSFQFVPANMLGEEIEHAEVVVPQCLLTSVFLNGMLGFGFLIALLFSMGDLKAALSTPTGFPIIEIFLQATQSKRATTAMIAGIICSAIFSTFGLLASASRTTWAFARDKSVVVYLNDTSYPLTCL